MLKITEKKNHTIYLDETTGNRILVKKIMNIDTKRKIKNSILIGITIIMALLFLVSASSVDSEITYVGTIAYVSCIISEVWFILFMSANIKHITQKFSK